MGILMKGIKEGSVGYLLEYRKYSGLNQAGEVRATPKFVYVGSQPGAGVEHLIFKSINGGYLTSITDIDFLRGDIVFSPDAASKPKPRKKTRTRRTKREMSCHNMFASSYNKGGFI